MSHRLFTASIVAAVAFGPAAHGAVVVTALTDPLFLRDEFFGSYHPVDVDGSGTTDFTFGYNPGFVGIRTEAANRVIFSPDPPPNLGGPVASLSHGFLVQSTLDSSTFSWRSSDLLGGFVSPGENAFASIVHALSTGSSTDFNGRGYIGVEFESTLGTHYGYLDIEAGSGFDGITFYGWAYESRPGVPLFAGQVPEPSVLVLVKVAAVSFLSRRRRK